MKTDAEVFIAMTIGGGLRPRMTGPDLTRPIEEMARRMITGLKTTAGCALILFALSGGLACNFVGSSTPITTPTETPTVTIPNPTEFVGSPTPIRRPTETPTVTLANPTETVHPTPSPTAEPTSTPTAKLKILPFENMISIQNIINQKNISFNIPTGSAVEKTLNQKGEAVLRIDNNNIRTKDSWHSVIDYANNIGIGSRFEVGLNLSVNGEGSVQFASSRNADQNNWWERNGGFDLTVKNGQIFIDSRLIGNLPDDGGVIIKFDSGKLILVDKNREQIGYVVNLINNLFDGQMYAGLVAGPRSIIELSRLDISAPKDSIPTPVPVPTPIPQIPKEWPADQLLPLVDSEKARQVAAGYPTTWDGKNPLGSGDLTLDKDLVNRPKPTYPYPQIGPIGLVVGQTPDRWIEDRYNPKISLINFQIDDPSKKIIGYYNSNIWARITTRNLINNRVTIIDVRLNGDNKQNSIGIYARYWNAFGFGESDNVAGFLSTNVTSINPAIFYATIGLPNPNNPHNFKVAISQTEKYDYWRIDDAPIIVYSSAY